MVLLGRESLTNYKGGKRDEDMNWMRQKKWNKRKVYRKQRKSLDM